MRVRAAHSELTSSPPASSPRGPSSAPDAVERASPQRRKPTLREHRGLLEVGIFAAGYLTYFGVRAATQGDTAQAVANAQAIIDLERNYGLAVEGRVQEAFLASPLLVDALNAVYMYGHWPVIIGGGVLLFRYSRDHYYRLRNAILLTGLIGLAIFALYPVAPPRLTDLPVVDTVTQEAEGYRQIIPPSLVNEYAAMPSFHVGWNVLLGIVVFAATRRWWLRAMAVAGPAAMAVAVIVSANHYVVDVVAGVAMVLVAWGFVDLAERRHRVRTMTRRDVRRCAPGRQRRAPARARRGAGAAADRGRPAPASGPHRGAAPQDAGPDPASVGQMEAGAAVAATASARPAARRARA
jgi:hypothetical protein